MTDDIDTFSKKIINGLDDTQIAKDVSVANISPKEHFLKSVLDLVTDQLHKASDYDIVIDAAIEKVKDRVEHNELSVSELMDVISLLTNKKLDLVKTAFAPFQNSQKSILDSTSNGDDFEKGLKEYNPEQLKLIDKIVNVISKKGTND
jgi:hypothetical protein